MPAEQSESWLLGFSQHDWLEAHQDQPLVQSELRKAFVVPAIVALKRELWRRLTGHAARSSAAVPDACGAGTQSVGETLSDMARSCRRAPGKFVANRIGLGGTCPVSG